MTPNSILLASDTHGIYGPMRVLERYAEQLTNKELFPYLIIEVITGPSGDNEGYYESFDEICENCNLIIKGIEYKIVQQGNIWAVPLSELQQLETWNG